jgi:hypothetical protein
MTDLKRNLFIFIAAFAVGLVSLSATDAFALETQSDWDTWFANYYSDQDPMLDITDANKTGILSWRAHYWVRAYVTMAKTFKDSKYLDKAVTLIDFLLDNRDKIRDTGGEIDIESEPYLSAPLYFLNNKDVAAPGWRIWVSTHWRIQTLDDGQITHAIMRFVDFVYNNPEFPSYQAKAAQYLAAVEEIVPTHDTVYVFDRFDGIPGSYYYPNPDGTGLFTGAVPYNHSATMGVTLLLLDKIKGGVPEYRQKAEALLGFLKNHLRLQANDSYVWDYNPQSSAGGAEDFNHGHIDLSFVVLAYKRGLDLTEQDMKRFANTITKNLYQGNGELAYTVDGVEPNTSKNYYPIAFDWIDLAEFDTSIVDIAKEVYNKNYPNPSWSRPFLGWAEILWWSKLLKKPEPPQNLQVIDASAE